MTENPFRRLRNAGYERLCPIVPPGAELSPKSNLFRRLHAKKPEDARGKAPGIRWGDGTWSGFDFVSHESTSADDERWFGMGASAGVKTGRQNDGSWLVALDCDCARLEDAKIIRDLVLKHFGIDGKLTGVRIGRPPKFLIELRTDADFQFRYFPFGPKDEHGRRDRIEILSEGKQFVALGTHPKTGKPYDWPYGLPALADVPYFSTAAIDAFMAEAHAVLPMAGALTVEGSASAVDQSRLLGDIDLVRRAVEATPNRSDIFDTRESYVQYGLAIKAACGPDHEMEGIGLFIDWCMRWEDPPPGGGNDPDVAAADWSRMKGPFRRGASWLYELAERWGTGFGSAAVAQWFDAAAASAAVAAGGSAVSLFGDENPQSVALSPTPYAWTDPVNMPRRQWLYGYHYIRKYVGATVAPSAVGKSSLTMVEALAMASGKPLLGITPKEPLRVWIWNGEDPQEELDLRVAAILQHYGLSRADIGDRLYVDSGLDQRIAFAKAGRDGALIAQPVVDAVISAIRERSIDVMILDPFVSTYSGPETNEMFDPIVKKWSQIAKITNTSIGLVHHTRKLNGGESTVESARGGGALIAGARTKRALAGMSKIEAKKFGVAEENRKRFFRMTDADVNMAAVALNETEWFENRSTFLPNGENVGVATVRSVEVDHAADIDDAISTVAAALDGQEWRDSVRAAAWLGHGIADALALDAEADKERIIEIIAALKRRRMLKSELKYDKNRNTVRWVTVVAEEKRDGGAFG